MSDNSAREGKNGNDDKKRGRRGLRSHYAEMSFLEHLEELR